jgi:hypothetical protein
MATAHIVALKMDSYNPAKIAGTSVTSAVSTGVNSVSGWGVPGQNGCMGGNPSLSCASGERPFSVGGTIYWPIQAQYDGDYFGVNRQAIIRSPDRMQHWCNWANVQAYGGCTSANWSSAGDVITANSMTYNGQLKTAVQWPWPDYSFGNVMARLYAVPWGPDTATGPVVPAGVDSRVDTSYTYAFGIATTNGATDPTPVTLHRVSTAGCLLTGCDDPGNWQHKNGSTWDSNYLNSTGLTLLNADATVFTPQNAQSISVMYSPDARMWFLLLSCANCTYADTMFSAVIPDGPWTMMAPSIGGGPSTGGAQGFIDASYTSLGGGNFKISVTGNAGGSAYVMHFNEWTFTLASSPITGLSGSGKFGAGGKLLGK